MRSGAEAFVEDAKTNTLETGASDLDNAEDFWTLVKSVILVCRVTDASGFLVGSGALEVSKKEDDVVVLDFIGYSVTEISLLVSLSSYLTGSL